MSEDLTEAALKRRALTAEAQRMWDEIKALEAQPGSPTALIQGLGDTVMQIMRQVEAEAEDLERQMADLRARGATLD